MRRTKAWWGALTVEERSYLVYAERLEARSCGGGSPYLPDDCSECRVCGMPMMGSGTCSHCGHEIERIIDKANEAMKEA